MRNKGVSNLIIFSIGAIILLVGFFFFRGTQNSVQPATENAETFPTSGDVQSNPDLERNTMNTSVSSEIPTPETVPVKKSQFSLSGVWDAMFGEAKRDIQVFEELRTTLLEPQSIVGAGFDRVGVAENNEQVVSLTYKDNGQNRKVYLRFPKDSYCVWEVGEGPCVGITDGKEVSTGDNIRVTGNIIDTDVVQVIRLFYRF